MATVYKVQITSHWQNYTPAQFQALVEDALNRIETPKGNSIQVQVLERY